MRIRVSHISLKWDQSNKQHTHDIEKVFRRWNERRVAWGTGTEAGPGGGNTAKEIVRIAKKYGYRVWVPSVQGEGAASRTDAWIAVREDLVTKDWKTGFDEVVPGSFELYRKNGHREDMTPRWGPKGPIWVSFFSKKIGSNITVVAGHYLTDARSPDSKIIGGVDRWEMNKKIAHAIGELFFEKGEGRDLVFYGGDQNMADHKNDEAQGDTFFGRPITSVQDELKQWKDTGHGPIDVIATYDRDKRVSAVKLLVLGDRNIFLHTDHKYLEGIIAIKDTAN